MPTPHPYDLVIGLDRSDTKADLCLIDTHSAQRRSVVIDTAPETLREWLLELRQQYPQARVGLCLEQPAVHLISFLEVYPWITLHPINPIGDPTNLQRYSGVAPVTKKSGGSCYIHRRYLCPKFNRQGFHEYAKESILWCRWAAAYYLQQRERGASHHTAVRALAFKWQRILWKCWQTHTSYDDARYEAVLRRRGSAVANLFERVELGKSPWKNPVKKS